MVSKVGRQKLLRGTDAKALVIMKHFTIKPKKGRTETNNVKK